MALKRIANSPLDCSSSKMPPKTSNIFDKTTKIVFEVDELNGKKFYGALSEAELLYIWEKIFKRTKEEIFAMSHSRSLTRNFRATFILKNQIDNRDFFAEPNFEYRRKGDKEGETDVFACHFVGYNREAPAELGKLTRITVKTNDFAVDPVKIQAWLAKFGTVSANFDFVKNSLGIRSDVFETEIVLQRHVPEFLPIDGRKVCVSYPGIPKSCINCYMSGHMKRGCRRPKVEWIDKVNEFKKSGEFSNDMFGDWIDIIQQKN